MRKRIVGLLLAAAICAGTLCGCAESGTETPLVSSTDSESSEETQSGSRSESSESTYKPNSVSETTVSQSSSVSSSENVSEPESVSEPSDEPAVASSVEPVITPPDNNNNSEQETVFEPAPPETSSSVASKPVEPVVSSSTVPTPEPKPESEPKPEPVSSSSSVSEPVVDKPVVNRASILDSYTVKWGYNRLNSSQKKAYERLFKCAEKVGKEADISDLDISVDDINKVFWAFDYDNPQFLEFGSGYGYSSMNGRYVTISITYGRKTSEIRYSEFNSAAQGVIAEAKNQRSDYDKLKYIHDWIVNNTIYTNSGAKYESEADGVLVHGRAICEGYSKAFMYLAQSLGFECVCIVGTSGGGDHMWNMVKLGGNWYHVDVTWDDPVMSDGSQTLRYNYFLISDKEIKSDHTINTPFSLPSAPNNYQ